MTRRLIVATVIFVGFGAAPAAAQDTLNCDDFATQEEAQAEHDSNPSDPLVLDGNDNDGIACETLPSGGGATEADDTTSDSTAAMPPAARDGDTTAGGTTPTPMAAQAVLDEPAVTTTTGSTTTTTIAPPPPVSPDSPSHRPPSAVLASAAGEVQGQLGSYCWTAPTGPDYQQTLCSDAFPPDPSLLPSLAVERGASLSISFSTTASPTEADLRVTSAAGADQRLDVSASNPIRLAADLSPGEHVLVLFTRWDAGDATYYFRVQVDSQPSGPTKGPRRLPATGTEAGKLAGAGAVALVLGAVVLLARDRRA